MEGNHHFRSDPHSDFIIDFLYGSRKFKVLLAALNEGIFDDLAFLGKGDWVAESTLAQYRGYDVEVTRRLLNALAAMRLLDRGKTVYCPDCELMFRNTIAVNRYLLRESPNSLIPLLYVEEIMMPLFLKNLPYVLKHGSVEQFPRLLWRGGYPQDDAFLTLPDFALRARLDYVNSPNCYHSKLQPLVKGQHDSNDVPPGAIQICDTHSKNTLQLARELFLASWDGQQEQCLAALLEAFNLRGYQTIVDLGGGSGRLAWHIVQAHPHITVYVFDTPKIMQAIQRPNAVFQNLQYLSGDFFCDLLPLADCYILSHVLHEYDDERVILLLGRIYDHLNQGGVLIIMEKVMQDDKRAPLTCILDDILTATVSRGRERTEAEFNRLLEMSGFRHLQVKKILGVNTFDIMIARKPCQPCKDLPP